jgi:hypothetical protein
MGPVPVKIRAAFMAISFPRPGRHGAVRQASPR